MKLQRIKSCLLFLFFFVWIHCEAVAQVPEEIETRLLDIETSVGAIRNFYNRSETEISPITVVSNKKDLTKRLGQVQGVEETDGKVRIYFWNRGAVDDVHGIFYSESEDLKDWSEPEEIEIRGHPHQKELQKGGYFYPDEKLLSVFYHKGWKALGQSGKWVLSFESDDGRIFKFVSYQYEKGGQEGGPRAFFENGKYHIYDRGKRIVTKDGIAVRTVTWFSFPEDEWGQLVRGQPKVIADPRDYFDWSGPLKPDFYTANIGKDFGTTSVFFKDDRRQPDRDDKIRITGPVYPIHTNAEGDHLEIINNEPAIDLTPFERVWDAPLATSDRKEVGQIHCFPKLIREEYLACFVREDEHYTSRQDGRHLNEIVLARYKKP